MECYVIFCSGAEDNKGYLWDRLYRCCLQTFAHNDVVNCVAFNPVDEETLVTVSDDNTIKVWRSRHQMRLTKESDRVGSKSFLCSTDDNTVESCMSRDDDATESCVSRNDNAAESCVSNYDLCC